jgi:nickel/cobalt transporter (NicO) family protein
VLTRTGLGTIMGRLLPGLTLISRVALGLAGIALVVVAVLALLEKF